MDGVKNSDESFSYVNVVGYSRSIEMRNQMMILIDRHIFDEREFEFCIQSFY